MSFIGEWVDKIGGKVAGDIEEILEGLFGLAMFYALEVQSDDKTGEQKKAEVTEYIIAEIEEPGGIDLPKWFSPKLARVVLRWIIDQAVARLKARGFLKGSPPA